LSYSRGDETDADRRGLDYLDAAGIDTGGLARLFDRLEETYGAADEGEEDESEANASFPSLFSTHPATAERAAMARARSRSGLAPSLTDQEWRVVRSSCGMVLEDEVAEEAPPKKPEELDGGAKPE
jgi:predicted Zn-dependent protease